MTRRLWYIIPCSTIASCAIVVGSIFFLDWFGGYQTQKWREDTILRSTGKDLPREVIDEIESFGKVPVHHILALGWAESKGDPEAVSRAGALGWLQIMPTVATQYGFTPEEMHDPVKCAHVGVRHLYEMSEAFGHDTRDAVSAYNCGIKGWKRHMNAGTIPKETRELQKRYFLRVRVYGRFLREGVIE